MTLTFGSLFAGIGGFDLGLERAGITCKWQVEINGFCQKVLAKHWPDVRRYGDVRNVGKHNLETVDLICGGFPCQDISNAGKRAGIQGQQSGLWSEFCRIICELQPRFVLVENVAALLVRGMDVVLGDLAACGYDAEWQCLPAAAFGAPHKRDRVFIIAYSQSSNAEGTSKRYYSRQPNYPGFWTELRYQSKSSRTIRVMEGWSQRTGRTYTNVLRVADGIPNRVDRLRALGNAVVPQIAEWIGRQIVEYDAKLDKLTNNVV